ncbi:SCO2322 family protein [Streptomyces sp. NRRL S-87]|uniref:SCO2322 family protein n=1 Tax=Streptomyces sp. NRRL S-87 TaxID=1463920 RepID=UPI0004C01141|nr:SCO2322 family protein [Streptomyces sp. NRRL S-87]
MRPGRRAYGVLVLGTLCALLLGAGPAAATGYRYWSFWDGAGGTWRYSGQGPSTARPADGDVQGFRFAVSEDSADADRPRAEPDFAAVCGATAPAAGKKRVALVIDFGVPADAPAGETPPRTAPRTACATVAPDATAAEALAAVAKPLRYDSAALLCAIAGYPERGCGEQISASDPQRSAPPSTSTDTPATGSDPNSGSGSGSGSGGTVGLVLGVGAVAALGTAAALKSRRRSR